MLKYTRGTILIHNETKSKHMVTAIYDKLDLVNIAKVDNNGKVWYTNTKVFYTDFLNKTYSLYTVVNFNKDLIDLIKE